MTISSSIYPIYRFTICLIGGFRAPAVASLANADAFAVIFATIEVYNRFRHTPRWATPVQWTSSNYTSVTQSVSAKPGLDQGILLVGNFISGHASRTRQVCEDLADQLDQRVGE
ncbi:MAG: hypothetical protein JW963_02825 [Anaerolineales bacterium]|nr:hypothetical protein [Anaerolineales bacterium]